MANTFKSSEFLDFDKEKFAGMLALIAPDGLGQIEVFYPVQPRALQNPPDGCRRHGGDLGDVLSGEALTAQGDHVVELIPSKAEQIDQLRAAIAFQNGLTKQGKPKSAARMMEAA